MIRSTVVVSLLLLLAVTADAAMLQHGDVLGVGHDPGVVIGEIFHSAQWIRGTTPLDPPLHGPMYGIALAPDGRFAIVDSLGLFRMDRDFRRTGSLFAFGSGMVFDRTGALFSLDLDGQLVQLDLAGTPLRSADFGLADRFVAIDLDRDQCTLYVAPFAPPSAIRRFDVCAWRPLPDLSASLVEGGGLRVDRDGTVLASSGKRILRFSRNGRLLAEYEFDLSSAIGPFAFDADDGSLWLAAGSTYKVDLAARRVIAGPFPASSEMLGYGVVDEPRAALLPLVPPASVPALGPIALAVLAGALLLAAGRLP